MVMSRERFKHYASGNKELDDEHFELLNMLDDVLGKFKRRDTNAISACNTLLTRLRVHIEQEELCMIRLKYPYSEYHIADHTSQEREIQELLADKHENEFKMQLFLEKLSVRFVDHIDHFDLQFTNWLKNKYGGIDNFHTLKFSECNESLTCV
jgi:hemerythrin-like metal-binding protein